MDMVNDAETTRKRLTAKIANETQMLETLKSKKKFIRVSIVLFILFHAAYYYLFQTIVIEYLMYSLLPLLVIWGTYFFCLKYLSWQRSVTEKKIKNTSITADTEIK